MITIAFYNNKGGVGKTTSVYTIGYKMAQLGNKVLVIDGDSQGSLTDGGLDEKDYQYTFYHLLNGEIEPSKIPIPFKKNLFNYDFDFDIIPNDLQSSLLDLELVNKIGREKILKKQLKEIKKNYDIILIDCSPSMSVVNVNILVASDYYIIPCQLEYYSLRGVEYLNKFVETVKEENDDLKLLGSFGTFRDKRKKSNNEILAMLKDHFKDDLFKTVIGDSVKVSEAPSSKMTIIEYDKNNIVAKNYDDLTNEIINKLKVLQ